jgi:hypothetical protein
MVPELFMHVAAHAVQIHSRQTDLKQREVDLRALEAQLNHQANRDDLQAEIARKLIDSLMSANSERVTIVQAAFREVLGVLKTQADHYMAQQSKLEDAKIESRDLVQRIQYDARILEIDEQLADIRSKALSLFNDMNKVLLQIGGNTPPLSGDFQHVLRLQ